MAIEGGAMGGRPFELGETSSKEENLLQEEAFAALMHALALAQPQQKGEKISPDDEAWVNSCLVGDPELWEIGTEGSGSGSTKEVAEIASPNIASEMMEDIDETHEPKEDAPPAIVFKDKYLFDDREEGGEKLLFEDLPGQEKGDGAELEDEKQLLDDDDDDIFKVWDLGTPEEEDVLIMQLKKALAQERLGDDDDLSSALKQLKQLDLDELVAGIADFKPFSE